MLQICWGALKIIWSFSNHFAFEWTRAFVLWTGERAQNEWIIGGLSIGGQTIKSFTAIGTPTPPKKPSTYTHGTHIYTQSNTIWCGEADGIWLYTIFPLIFVCISCWEMCIVINHFTNNININNNDETHTRIDCFSEI